MRVRITSKWMLHEPGEVLDLADHDAKRLIERGQAVRLVLRPLSECTDKMVRGNIMRRVAEALPAALSDKRSDLT